MKILAVYLIAVNLITFALFGIDKLVAIKKRSRIRVATLLSLAFIGGSVGGLSAMYLFRHKIKKPKFTIGVPLMLVAQAVLFFYLKK